MLRRLCTARETKLQLAGEPSTQSAGSGRGKDHFTRMFDWVTDELTDKAPGSRPGAPMMPVGGHGSSLAMWTIQPSLP
ncbi:hypothetical protein GCM10010518_29060 [Kitasatospora cinereorecta]